MFGTNPSMGGGAMVAGNMGGAGKPPRMNGGANGL